MKITPEIKAICKQLEDLYKAEIKKKGLVESGKLLNSITFFVVETSNGLSFQMKAVDYFKYVDAEKKISKDVRASSGWKSILKQIAKINNIYIQELIQKELRNI